MTLSFIVADLASELALFAAAGFLLFALDDLAVDLIYFSRRLWRAATVYTRYPRAFADRLTSPERPGCLALFVPAWDEGDVVAAMLRSTLERWGDHNYRIFVGHYPNDPATAAALGAIADPKVETVLMPMTRPDHQGRLSQSSLRRADRDRTP